MIFVGFLFFVMWNFFLEDLLMPKDEERVPYDDFIGKQYSDVFGNEKYKQYTFQAIYENNDTIPEGQIIDQDPGSDESYLPSKGPAPVKLTVSAGEKSVVMKNYINSDYRVATHELESLSVDVNVIATPQVNDSYTPGYVFEQVPAEGEILKDGMTVYLTYSTGPDVKLVKVPNLLNYTENTAMSRLEAMGLVGIKKEEYNETAPAGRVFFQNYEPETEVEVGTEVEFYISLGPEPTLPPETEPPETQPPSEPTWPFETQGPQPTESYPTIPDDTQGGDVELGDDQGVEPRG